MSKPSAGTYVIVNRVLSPSGEELAITHNGQGKAVTVTPRSDSAAQKWVIRDFDTKTQTVSPSSATDLQAAFGPGHVTVLPAGGYVWVIRSTDSGYTIQDGGLTVFWGVPNANVNDQVSLEKGSSSHSDRQRWVLIKV